MFVAVALALVFVTAHVTARDVPPYLNVCGRRDPKLDECIIDNLNNLKNKIREGFLDLDIPSNDPLHLNKIVIINTDTAKLYLRDVDILGLSTYVINYFHIDLDKHRYNIKVSFEHINLNSTLDFNIHVLVPITTNGKAYATSDKVGANLAMDLKTVTKGGKKYIYVSKAKLDLDIKDFDIKFETDGNADQLREIIRNFLGNNRQEVIKTFKPLLEEEISKALISITNNILKYFTYDQLFPDRT